MALLRAVGSFVAPTSTAADTTVTCTDPTTSATFTPKLVILAASVKTTSDGFATTCGAGFGAASGTATTAQWAIGVNGADNVATSDTAKELYDGILAIPNTAGSAALWQARLKSFDAAGFTLDWIVVSATGIVVEYLALGGPEFSAECGRVASSTLLGNQQVPTSIQGEAMLLSHASSIAVNRTTTVHWGLGAATSPTARWCWSARASDGQTMAANVDGERAFRDEKIVVVQAAGATYDAQADFVSFEATPRFTINWTDAAGAAFVLGYCVMRGVSFFCGSSAKPTAAAPQNQDFSVGFTPKAVLVGHAQTATATTVAIGNAVAGLGFSDGTTEGSIWAQHNDTINTDANVRTLSTKVATMNTAPSTAESEADADVAAVANTVRLTWNPNGATAYGVGILALGDPAGAPAAKSLPPFQRPWRFTPRWRVR